MERIGWESKLMVNVIDYSYKFSEYSVDKNRSVKARNIGVEQEVESENERRPGLMDDALRDSRGDNGMKEWWK